MFTTVQAETTAAPTPRVRERVAPPPVVGGRDARLDLLRGLCVAVMILSHGLNTPLTTIVHAGGYFTGAEGFFLISGVTLGLVYRRRIARTGIGGATRTLWRRAATLWLWNTGLVVAFSAWDLFGSRYGFFHFGATYRWVFYGQWTLDDLLRFDYPYFLQILPRYVAFLLVAPLAVWLLQRGRGSWVVAASVLAWGLAQSARLNTDVPFFENNDLVGFRIMAWQLPFFLGTVIGWNREELAPLWRRLTSRPGLLVLATVAFGFAVMHLLDLHGTPLLDGRPRRLVLARGTLAAGRVLNAFAAYALIFWAVDRCWPAVWRVAGRALLPLGHSALTAFLLHIPLVYVLLTLAKLGAVPEQGWRVTPLNVAVLVVIWGVCDAVARGKPVRIKPGGTTAPSPKAAF